MKNRFVKITLTLSMLLVMAVPTQAFAAEQWNPTTLIKNYYSNPYTQFAQGTIAKFSVAIAGNQVDYAQLQNILKNFNIYAPNKNTTPAVPATPAQPAKPVPAAPAQPAKPAPAVPEQPVKETPAAPVVTPKPATPSTSTTPASSSIGAYEQQVVDLVNKERAAVGLPALKVNTKLAAVAEKKAEDLRDNNYFAHQSPTYGSPFDMMKQFGITYTSAGENIAKGQKTPEAVMNGWMNSQGHKDNILNSSYTEIGVGYVTDSNGTTYWVQHFIRP